jgi:hypothetical protein
MGFNALRRGKYFFRALMFYEGKLVAISQLTVLNSEAVRKSKDTSKDIPHGKCPTPDMSRKFFFLMFIYTLH